MHLLLAVLTLQTVFCLDLMSPEWITFKAKYNRTYSSPAEEASRLKIFTANLRRIEEHNAGRESYRLGVNGLADLSEKEYQQMLAPAAGDDSPVCSPVAGPLAAAAGNAKDWRDEGAVTGVRNTGTSCAGASWAFAAAAAVESAWKIAGNPLVRLSEQQLIDCSRGYGTAGCVSGLPQHAFEYLMDSAGLSSATDYPYYGGDWGECSALSPVATIANWMRTTRGSELELEYVVANIGPVTARLDASHTAFQLYSDGVYDQSSCSTTQLNLAVEIVGYGSEEQYGQLVHYWLVKNAWGPGWGEYGYMKIRKDAQNMCGIATDVTYPVV